MSVAASNLEYTISFKRVGGTGIMGVWFFDVWNADSRWVVEFIPERIKYSRVNMMPQSSACAVPDNVVQGFSNFICDQHNTLPVQRLRKPRKTPPGAFLDALAAILLNEELHPENDAINAVENEVLAYFKNPQFILPVKGRPNRYWFRSPEMGRFFVTHLPPTVS